MSPTAERLDALAAHLGESASQVAATLRDELTRALADIDDGLAGGDEEHVARATHAARNSVLMLDDRPMLDALRAVDAAAARQDRAGVAAARGELQARWLVLRAELDGV